MRKYFTAIILLSILIQCSSDGGGEELTDSFDRETLLISWADNIIIPAFSDLSGKLEQMTSATHTFTTTPTESNLLVLREKWIDAYKAWQWVEMFDIGKAEEITLRNYVNVYPLNEIDMTATLLSGNYDLGSINRQDEQGFSAVDYLLHGVANSDTDIVGVYTNETDGDKYKTYLTDIVVRIEMLVNQVNDDWNNGYRDAFVSRSGSSATESVNKLTNDYLLYYEKYLRAGKIGIPAGVFSAETLSDKVEARFRGNLSKELFMEALNATQYFFQGIHFSGTTDGLGFDDYLEHLSAEKEDLSLAVLINTQFETSRTQADALSDDLSEQVETNNDLMLMTYDELQKNVVHMKVDMFQAMNVQVDYVDADGD